ncbi:MAG: ATP-binding protein [Oscillospiraceae bacterium]|nr:ATP-binding protein [Oscillospiraceae bacterium]
MKKLPLGIQNIAEIISGDYVYVDKTRHIYNLINGTKYNFLSRPRRFGKSLLLDTIGEVFNGNRELFKGLWIYGSDYPFDKHPVIRLDMSNISNANPEILKKSLAFSLKMCIEKEGLNIVEDNTSYLFKRLIKSLHDKYSNKVVVLIDEYDKPILDHIDNADVADANRQVVRGFYGILKSMEPYLRFTFITGVSKFTKTSIFSELNNLNDITMVERYADICGIPIGSLNNEFDDHIKELSCNKKFSKYNSIRDLILAWYDGYTWDGESRVINPFALITFLEQKRLNFYWYASGSPKLLIDIIKKKPESYFSIKNLKITENQLDSFDIRNMELEPLLFQTGYLTVKEVVETMGPPIYVLEIPNYEVRDAFNMQIVIALTESGGVRAGQAQMAMSEALAAGDLQKVLDILRGLFASIPYNLHVDLEAYYHSIFYAVMTILGFDMDVEVSVSKGRIDAVLELADAAYVFEFKYCKCAPDAAPADRQALYEATLGEAMAQIKARGYADKYKGSGKTIYQAAFAFLGRDAIEMRVETLQ